MSLFPDDPELDRPLGRSEWEAMIDRAFPRGPMKSDYRYDAVEAGQGNWMVHRRWIEDGHEYMDEASLYGEYTTETAIQEAIRRGSWA